MLRMQADRAAFALGGVCVVVMAFVSGCATVLTPLPESEFHHLDENRTYYIVTKSGETRQTAKQTIEDSTLVIRKPRAALHDPRPYPARISMSDIESISTVRTENLVYVESGLQAGKNYGDDSQGFSPFLFVTELGYISGERGRTTKPPAGYGATLYMAASNNDFRGALKARVRYRFNRHVSIDGAGGPLLGDSGFVTSLGVNLGTFVTLKTEWMSYEFEPWTDYDGNTRTYHPTGTEQVWYSGMTFRNGAGWMAMTLEIGAGIAMMMAVTAALGSSN